MDRSQRWVFLASGPSMCEEDIELVRQYRDKFTVSAINNQIFSAPWADNLYSCDSFWFRQYAHMIPSDCTAKRFSGDRLSLEWGAKYIPIFPDAGLGKDRVHSGNNSGYQEINRAYLRGMRVGILLGYDMKEGPNGERHCHVDHPPPLGNFGIASMCARKFPQLARDLQAEGVIILNATRDTALDCFERVPLQDALEMFSST